MADHPALQPEHEHHVPDGHDGGPVDHDHDHDHDHQHQHQHQHQHDHHDHHDHHHDPGHHHDPDHDHDVVDAPPTEPNLSADTPPPATAAAAAVAAAAAAKERHSLTLDQRRALRRWANSQTIRPSHKTCIEWFFSQYGQGISQSTVSHSLSPKYSRLDGDNPQLSGSRLRFGNWPDVEKLVLLWYQQVQASGRQPTNEELGEKAKSIFSQLPRYKDEQAPEFSPGWIHRFKKRYGLLVRRQRRHGDPSMSPAEDINYLADCVPRFMAISSDTSPAAIKESVLRVVGVEATLNTCAHVRDEIIRRAQNPALGVVSSPQVPPPVLAPHPHNTHPTDPNLAPAPDNGDTTMYGTGEEDPEVVLQNALRQLQQEEADAEASAAAAREEREQRERAQGTAAAALATPAMNRQSLPRQNQSTWPPTVPSNGTPTTHGLPDDLSLTPIKADIPLGASERPLRCPFCVNTRMLRSIKEAVEHLSTHVVV